MAGEVVLDTIKNIVHSCLPDARVLLFGSHARGDHNAGSDYDLLVVNPQVFTRAEKLNYSSRLHKAIVKAINAPVDLLLYSEDEVTQKKELPGHIIRYAVREGVAL